MKSPALFFSVLLIAHAVMVGPRTSPNYSILTDTNDSGGKRASSAAYTNDGSAGGIAGISTVAAHADQRNSALVSSPASSRLRYEDQSCTRRPGTRLNSSQL